MSAKKQIIAIILSFAMVIGMCATTFAAESIPDIAGITQEDYVKELDNTIKDYITACEIDVSNLSMSQPIPINGSNDENIRAIFLFSGMKCIALMMFTYVNNEYISSFSEGDYAEITEALSKNQDITLVSNEKCMVMLMDDSWKVVSGNEDFAQETVLSKARVSFEGQALNLTPIVFSDEDLTYASQRSAEENTLNVTQAYNIDHPDDSKRGMCWAASMVSIIRYRAGTNKLAVIDLYNMLKSKYPPSIYKYPIGTCVWIGRSYELFSLSYTHKHSGTSYPNVKSIIQNKRPIYAKFDREEGAHGVVIAGYGTTGPNNYYYKIMDPGTKVGHTALVTFKLPSPDSTSFAYSSPNGFTYTSWSCHMY